MSVPPQRYGGKTALVTGATGFVGNHVARAALERGFRVRCLARAGSDRRLLDALPQAAGVAAHAVEVVEGSLTDPDSLRRAAQGVTHVFHVAADYRLFVRDPAGMHAANVEGTRHILRAAADAGAERIVHTSSVGALGIVPGAAADEATPVTEADMVGPYKRTKFLAERVAEEEAAKGAPVVIVNPSTPVGEGDIKPTPTGRIIVDFLNGKTPAYVDTGLNLIDVRDCAEGHLLAAERGRVGEKYILGHRDMTLQQILHTLAMLTGRKAPKVRLPHWVPTMAAHFSTGWARLTRGEPAIPIDAVRMARKKMFFSPEKAVRELGLPQTPVEEALTRAILWFGQHGYLKGGVPSALQPQPTSP